ncbi:MAG: hypothetical protein ACJAWG_001855 [Candidatus Azotimanducaceae bacterium]|jgi:hypothetical protein
MFRSTKLLAPEPPNTTRRPLIRTSVSPTDTQPAKVNLHDNPATKHPVSSVRVASKDSRLGQPAEHQLEVFRPVASICSAI